MLVSDKRHFFLEGNIGAGKSTFLKIMESYLCMDAVFEPSEKWQSVNGDGNLLDMFYKDTSRWAYTFQTYAFVSRVVELRNADMKSVYSSILIERSVFSDRYCFAKNCYEMDLMTRMEWDLYKEWFDWLVDNYTVKPSGFIYLRTDPEICFERMGVRNRGEETGVSIDYIKKLHEKHENWLVKKEGIADWLKNVPVLILDCNKDFEHDPEEQSRHAREIADFFNIKLK